MPPLPFAALRHRNFRLFIFGQFVSLVGTWMQSVALGWLVLTLTDSAFAVGLVSASGALPVLLFSASDWFRAAWRSLRARHVTLDLPITLGLGVIFARSIVDIASGAGEGFLDSFAGLVFFLLLGRLVQQQTFDRIRRSLPQAEPSMRRANLMVSGIHLENVRDRVITIGDTRILLHGETRPCERMDEQCPGLTAALDTHWGGGAHGIVLGGGDIRVGDAVSLEQVAAAQSR